MIFKVTCATVSVSETMTFIIVYLSLGKALFFFLPFFFAFRFHPDYEIFALFRSSERLEFWCTDAINTITCAFKANKTLFRLEMFLVRSDIISEHIYSLIGKANMLNACNITFFGLLLGKACGK